MVVGCHKHVYKHILCNQTLLAALPVPTLSYNLPTTYIVMLLENGCWLPQACI